MARSPVAALSWFLLSAGMASGQCYVFSNGSTAFTVNITRLPAPTQSTTVPWIWHYSSSSGLAASVSLKVGSTTYNPDPSSVSPTIDITVASDPSSGFSDITVSTAFFSTGRILVGALADIDYWSGAYFPNGSLPATLPALSKAHDTDFLVSADSSSGTIFDQTLKVASISSCAVGGTTTPPVTAPPVTTPAPPPSVSSISPASPIAGSGSQVVTVFGSQFQNGLTANLLTPGGTTFILSGNQLQGVSTTAFQASMALTSPGTFSIRVINPDGQQSNARSFTVVAPSAAKPVISSNGGIRNSASFAQTAIAPGSLASIFGMGFAANNALAASIPFPFSLAGISVTFDGIPAAISGVFHDAVSGDQINVQVPWGVKSPGTSQVIVTKDGTSSSSQPAAIAAAVPGVFATQVVAGQIVGSGSGQAIAYSNADGKIAAQDGSIIGLSTHPAKINDQLTLVILATGLGAVDVSVKNGDVPSTLTANSLIRPTVTIGDVPAKVVFSGLVGRDENGRALGYVGVYQINVIISPGTPTGKAVPLQVSVNGGTSRSDVYVAVDQ